MYPDKALVFNDTQWDDGFVILDVNGPTIEIENSINGLCDLEWQLKDDSEIHDGVWILEGEFVYEKYYVHDYGCYEYDAGFNYEEVRELTNQELDDLVLFGYLFWSNKIDPCVICGHPKTSFDNDKGAYLCNSCTGTEDTDTFKFNIGEFEYKIT